MMELYRMYSIKEIESLKDFVTVVYVIRVSIRKLFCFYYRQHGL